MVARLSAIVPSRAVSSSEFTSCHSAPGQGAVVVHDPVRNEVARRHHRHLVVGQQPAHARHAFEHETAPGHPTQALGVAHDRDPKRRHDARDMWMLQRPGHGMQQLLHYPLQDEHEDGLGAPSARRRVHQREHTARQLAAHHSEFERSAQSEKKHLLCDHRREFPGVAVAKHPADPRLVPPGHRAIRWADHNRSHPSVGREREQEVATHRFGKCDEYGR